MGTPDPQGDGDGVGGPLECRGHGLSPMNGIRGLLAPVPGSCQTPNPRCWIPSTQPCKKHVTAVDKPSICDSLSQQRGRLNPVFARPPETCRCQWRAADPQPPRPALQLLSKLTRSSVPPTDKGSHGDHPTDPGVQSTVPSPGAAAQRGPQQRRVNGALLHAWPPHPVNWDGEVGCPLFPRAQR